MADIKLIIEPPIKLPQFTGLSREFWKDTGDAVIVSTLENISQQKQADGAPLKRNRPKTIAYKRKKGLGTRSLVAAERSFVNRESWAVLRFLPRGSGVEVGAREFKNLINKIRWTFKKGYRGYLGVNKRAMAVINKSLKEEIVRQFRKAGGR